MYGVHDQPLFLLCRVGTYAIFLFELSQFFNIFPIQVQQDPKMVKVMYLPLPLADKLLDKFVNENRIAYDVGDGQ